MGKKVALVTLATICFLIVGCGDNQVQAQNPVLPVVKESTQDSSAQKVNSVQKNEDALVTAVKEVQLSKDEIRKLNIFFSNFSEVYLEPFEKDNISNQQLIQFGFYHNYKNNWDLLKFEDSSVKIDGKHVEGSVNYFFGKSVKHESVDENLVFKDGNYYHPPAFGDPLPFSQVKELIDLGGDYYLACVDNYNFKIPPFDTEMFYNPIDEWYDKYKDSVMLIGRIKATIKKVIDDNNTRYILIDYLKTE